MLRWETKVDPQGGEFEEARFTGGTIQLRPSSKRGTLAKGPYNLWVKVSGKTPFYLERGLGAYRDAKRVAENWVRQEGRKSVQRLVDQITQGVIKSLKLRGS